MCACTQIASEPYHDVFAENDVMSTLAGHVDQYIQQTTHQKDRRTVQQKHEAVIPSKEARWEEGKAPEAEPEEQIPYSPRRKKKPDEDVL